MPLDTVQSTSSKAIKLKKNSIPRAVSSVESDANPLHNFSLYRSHFEGEPVIPALLSARLHDLFLQIEREFENLYSENISCELLIKIIVICFLSDFLKYIIFTVLL